MACAAIVVACTFGRFFRCSAGLWDPSGNAVGLARGALLNLRLALGGPILGRQGAIMETSRVAAWAGDFNAWREGGHFGPLGGHHGNIWDRLAWRL